MTIKPELTPLERCRYLRGLCAAGAIGTEISDDLWNEFSASVNDVIRTPCQTLPEIIIKLKILLDIMDEADRTAVDLLNSTLADTARMLLSLQYYFGNRLLS